MKTFTNLSFLNLLYKFPMQTNSHSSIVEVAGIDGLQKITHGTHKLNLQYIPGEQQNILVIPSFV